jgi:hypothetical protein
MQFLKYIFSVFDIFQKMLKKHPFWIKGPDRKWTKRIIVSRGQAAKKEG